MTASSPRFLVRVDFPVYGSRDEIVGIRLRTVATACTRAWADVLRRRYYEAEAMHEETDAGVGVYEVTKRGPVRDYPPAPALDDGFPF